MLAQSLNLHAIVLAQISCWFVIPLFPFFLIFVSALAETNRPPFDLPEAEAELVAGYNVEYSSMGFAYFFIGEYANILLMSAMIVILFLGGWLPPLNIKLFYILPGIFWFTSKLIIIIYTFIWIRAAFPRFRYDQPMYLTWRVFLPLSLAGFILVSGIIWSFYPVEPETLFILNNPYRFDIFVHGGEDHGFYEASKPRNGSTEH
jgi:NADH-quinone oxidoreductase subunit H